MILAAKQQSLPFVNVYEASKIEAVVMASPAVGN